MASPERELLAKYLAGEASAAETERVRSWLAARPESPVDVEAGLRRVREGIACESAPIPLERYRRFTPRVIGRTAAAVLATVTLVAVLARDRPAGPEAMAAAAPVRTGVGERDSVRLPDGTRILIGPSSEVVVATGGRAATVLGDAYFQVTHDERRAFVVNTPAGVITDVGTRFGVRAQGEELSVAVTEGVVQLRSRLPQDTGIVLKAGDRGRISVGRTADAQRQVVTRADQQALDRGGLVFRNAALPEVQSALRRWYGIDLQVQGSALARRHLTATFERESPAEVVQVIALALGANLERRGKVVVLQQTARQ